MKTKHINFIINGHQASLDVPPAMTLQTAIRDVLGLTGTKNGCGEGECGACTVLVDGLPVNSCLMPVCQAEGCRILTIEAFSNPSGYTHPLVESFIDQGAVQCGFCTPGMVLSSAALLNQNPAPDNDQIKSALSSNICRCTGYEKIFNAVSVAAENFQMPDPTGRNIHGKTDDDVAEIDVVRVETLAELDRLDWDKFQGQIRFLAGGTDLMVQKSNHQPCGDVWIDLFPLNSLKNIELSNGFLSIGALVTYAQLEQNELIAQYAPVLKEATLNLASANIRNRATIGGNIANASPCADGYPPLVAMDAVVITYLKGCKREIPVSHFAHAKNKTELLPGEILWGIRFPVKENLVSGYFKSMPRKVQGISKASVAIAVECKNGLISDARIGLGSVGPAVIRADKAETMLKNSKIEMLDLNTIAEAVLEAAHPIDDFRSSKQYRLRMLRAGTLKLLNRLLS